MKIGILGGSFNPPHLGHLHISELALRRLKLDQIWWVVTKRNPLKNAKDYEAHAARIQRCQALIVAHPKIKILQSSEIYTEKLITRLMAQHKNHRFTFVVGADVLEKFHLWKNFKKIISGIDLAIFSRGDFLLKMQKFPAWKFVKTANRYSIFFTKNNHLSSTELRASSLLLQESKVEK